MYHTNQVRRSKIEGVKSYIGETLEQKVHRIVTNKEPIKDGAPIIHTDRKDGVPPSYNIRTDRWEVAVEATDKISKSKIAKRENLGKVVPMDKKPEGNGNEGISTESSQ